jgi:hypothetical protein
MHYEARHFLPGKAPFWAVRTSPNKCSAFPSLGRSIIQDARWLFCSPLDGVLVHLPCGALLVQPATDRIGGLPTSVQGSFAGNAAVFQSSTSNMGWLLLVAVIVVYIILGILYESFIHPLTILSGLPSAALGALLTLYLTHIPITL